MPTPPCAEAQAHKRCLPCTVRTGLHARQQGCCSALPSSLLTPFLPSLPGSKCSSSTYLGVDTFACDAPRCEEVNNHQTVAGGRLQSGAAGECGRSVGWASAGGCGHCAGTPHTGATTGRQVKRPDQPPITRSRADLAAIHAASHPRAQPTRALSRGLQLPHPPTMASTSCWTELMCITLGGAFTSHHLRVPSRAAATRTGVRSLHRAAAAGRRASRHEGRRRRQHHTTLGGAIWRGIEGDQAHSASAPDPKGGGFAYLDCAAPPRVGAATRGVPRASCAPPKLSWRLLELGPTAAAAGRARQAVKQREAISKSLPRLARRRS